MKQKIKKKEELVEEVKLLQRQIVTIVAAETDIEQQQLRRLATVVRDSNDAIMLMDFDGRITTWNAGAKLMYGYSEQEALQMNIQQLTPLDKEAEHAAFIRRLTAGETIPSFETQRIAKDGRILDVWMTATKVLDELKKPVGVATTERDITWRKEMEKKVLASEKLATIGQLGSSVAHELRNPLAVIKNTVYYLNMLESVKHDLEIAENLKLISGEVEKSSKIINDLLEFSRVKPPTLRPEEINSIIREVLSGIKFPATIKLVTELSDDLPRMQVDQLQMQQVFFNLASNAVQAMEKGGTLTVSSKITPNKTVAVVFKDTGCGIPPENMSKILDPLFTTKVKGTGLGLTIVSWLVEGHLGELEIESQADQGSVFTVKLPIKGV